MKIREFIDGIDGLSENTKKSYEQTLWQLEEFCKGEEPTDDEVLKFLQGYESASSLQRHKAAIKAYFECQVPKRAWPFNHRQFSAVHRKTPKYLAAEIVNALINAADNEDDKAYVTFLFITGCRIHELMQITSKSLVPDGVQLVTKGGDTKLKVIIKSDMKALLDYAGKKRGRLFPENYSYYYKKLKELGEKVGHPEVSPHVLRHARALDL